MKTILLKFAGPLQSYGTSSHFETRHTDYHPSKSAVIGMIMAALGCRRNNHEKLDQLNKLHFAVRVDQQGQLLRDYHTVKKYKANGLLDRTYVTHRYYLEDAIFVVAIGHEDEELMTQIEDALLHPYFQLYQGKRSLPVLVDFYLGKYPEEPISLLKNYEWQASEWYQKNNGGKVSIYHDGDLGNQGPMKIRKDRPKSFDQKNRQFDFRYERRMDVILNTEDGAKVHDAFSALGGD